VATAQRAGRRVRRDGRVTVSVMRVTFLLARCEAGGYGGAGSGGEFAGTKRKAMRGSLIHVQISSSVQGEGTGFYGSCGPILLG